MKLGFLFFSNEIKSVIVIFAQKFLVNVCWPMHTSCRGKLKITLWWAVGNQCISFKPSLCLVHQLRSCFHMLFLRWLYNLWAQMVLLQVEIQCISFKCFSSQFQRFLSAPAFNFSLFQGKYRTSGKAGCLHSPETQCV